MTITAGRRAYIENAAFNFHEPYASSASELVTELLQYLVEPTDLLREEAGALLAGIVLDTKHFTQRTGGRTFEAAAFLRRSGADTAEVQRLFQGDLKDMVTKYDIIRRAEMYRSNIAVSVVEEPGADRVAAAQAADDLLTLKGVQASFVVYAAEGAVLTVSPFSGRDQRAGDPGGPGRRRQLYHRRRTDRGHGPGERPSAVDRSPRRIL